MSIPKAFISYSHDTLDHKKWVLYLAERLRESGIDAILDQWDLSPGDDIPSYMERHLSESDFTIMICTERYVEKANSGTGGVGYEKMIVTSHLMKNIDEKKVIPIVRQRGTTEVPTFLKTKLFVDFSSHDDFELSFDNLLRALHKAPILKKPLIGGNPFSDRIIESKSVLPDNSLEVLKIIVENYQKKQPSLSWDEIFERTYMTVIYAELGLKHLRKMEFIHHDKNGSIVLSDLGKFYAIENELAFKIKPVSSVEVDAQYPGGNKAWINYLNSNLRYPQEAIDKKIEGDVVVQFIVTDEGRIINVDVIVGPNELRSEAIRIIQKSGKWRPALQNGKFVQSFKKQLISFQIKYK